MDFDGQPAASPVEREKKKVTSCGRSGTDGIVEKINQEPDDVGCIRQGGIPSQSGIGSGKEGSSKVLR